MPASYDSLWSRRVSTVMQSSFPQSWIPPSCSWLDSTDLFALEVKISDPDVAAFVATGFYTVEIFTIKKHALAIANILGLETLRGQIEVAVWDTKLLRPSTDPLLVGSIVKAYCHGAFCLPESRAVLVLVGRTPPSTSHSWLPQSLINEANVLYAKHQTSIAEFEQRVREEKEERERLYEQHPDLKATLDKFDGIRWHDQQPVIRADSLLPYMPKATLCPAATTPDSDAATRFVNAALKFSNLPSPRDGCYEGIFSLRVGRKTLSMVTWEPYQGLVAYPEVRWAVQRRLPKALCNPRANQPSRPEFNSGLSSVDETNSIRGIANGGSDLLDALEDLQLDQSDYRNRVDDVRKEVNGQGFEAIAWFQPYHVWSEETWGIYFDARKLDDLALSFLDDFKAQRVHGAHSLAALLAFGLTYAHELFHAHVEASLSWLEINVQQPRYLRYQERVYQRLRETPDWLEEALANWSAWSWFKEPGLQSILAPRVSNTQGLDRVVEASLDLGPPGYREWRRGHQASTWRTFANQLSSGNPKIKSKGMSLPLESLLSGPRPYDFQFTDIPLRFVDTGVIATRLQSHPATLNVISRRELQKALKYYQHVVDVSGGNGSHEKWTGPDNRAFPVPRRDPVSHTVFKTFLDHVGIDKAIYIKQVRPNL